MKTDQEAIAAAISRSSGLEYLSPIDAYTSGFLAGVVWLRSQGEPAAWMNAKKDMTYFGHYNPDDVPLFLTPQLDAAPKEPT